MGTKLITTGILKTDSDYDKAIKRFEELFDIKPSPGTPEAEEYELLSLLIRDYDERHSILGPPDPIEHIKFVMEHRGLKRSDLEEFIGSSGRVSEVLSGRRNLTLTMIRKLHKGLGISAELLLNQS